MPDISMCQHKHCPSRKNCKRHADSGTVPSELQSYAHFIPLHTTGKCEHYWDVARDIVTVTSKNGVKHAIERFDSRYAKGVEPQITARPKRKRKQKD